MSERSFVGWRVAPRIGVVLPPERAPGWTDAAWWCALLEGWGFPAVHLRPGDPPDGCTTLVVPAEIAAGVTRPDGVSLLVTGDPASAPRGVVAFPVRADDLDHTTTSEATDVAFVALQDAAPQGLAGLWRWPEGAPACLVVDGDVDHPTGVDPECSRYVAPAIETARLAGFPAYGIFATASNVEAEPEAFPVGAEYYNHSYTHPYSHWNPAPWESLDDDEMAEELRRSDEIFRAHHGEGDHGVFRLPHFQWEAWHRSAGVLDRLGYRAESSVGSNHAVTGGFPFHQAREAWSERPADAAHLRTHPDPARRHAFLQLPISTDPGDLAFPNGCCSYNTFGEGVRDRTADLADYGDVLQRVLDDAVARRSLAHLFIDPPDAGYGRLPGDRADYASVVQRWLADAMARDDLAIMSTAGLTDWWLAREAALARLTLRTNDDRLVAALEDPPPGATLALYRPDAGWTYEPLEEDPR